MRKVLLIAVLALFGFSVNAQEGFKIGVLAGLPVGDAADFSSFNLGLDVVYHWGVSDSFGLGVATGFTNTFGKEMTFNDGGSSIAIDAEDVQFLPIAASGRVMVTEELSLGADLGYAVGINEFNDGGFYYRPIIGYNVGEKTELNFSYSGVSLDGGSWSTINLGVLFTL
ncbi:hypothetical protein SAMN04487911_10285 [Arenibacter nanhaiticus]|uniref:Outer membrane protein beta-barrel domain-containing protein n=1 Tax=Arenibacter nanhaiticus TaxID=558155 RepID=A0A1M6B6Y2_9FLAO|nr:hypothetical protein [Arenibacter nanhaiticus]SHI44407.1 hypothetical protein SAMN04487911_10285 [Arenibacter nanhaiticus]